MKYNPTAEHLEMLPDNRDPSTILMEMEEYDSNLLAKNYRECAIRFASIMSLAFSFILEASDKTCALYGIAYALHIEKITEGKSMREMGRDLGVSSGTISWYKKQFEAYINIKDI